METVVQKICQEMEDLTSHIFRTDFQYSVKSNLEENLPAGHCLVVMDFSENITLQAQDEIESAHWTQIIRERNQAEVQFK